MKTSDCETSGWAAASEWLVLGVWRRRPTTRLHIVATKICEDKRYNYKQSCRVSGWATL